MTMPLLLRLANPMTTQSSPAARTSAQWYAAMTLAAVTSSTTLACFPWAWCWPAASTSRPWPRKVPWPAQPPHHQYHHRHRHQSPPQTFP